MRERWCSGRMRCAGVWLCVIGGFCAGGYAETAGEFTPGVATPVHMAGVSRVHATALREIALAFGEFAPEALQVFADGAPLPGSLFVGLLDELTAAPDLARAGLINLHNIPPDTDAFEAFLEGGVLYLLGNTPRGMLQAAYELQEALRAEKTVPAGWHERGAFQIQQRFFHQRFDGWPGEPADIRYISHLGASHCLLTHDWHGDVRHLQAYVSSSVFPGAVDAAGVEERRAGLRRMVEACLDYGIEPSLWITELPCQGGPWVPEAERQRFLERFPGEVLSDCGTYQGKVLCFGHPQVQAYYRELIGNFFQAFPEISTLFLFGLDSGGEFCDPGQCARCRGMSKFEQRDRLIRFLLEEGRKARPGLNVLTTGWGWSGDTEQFLARQRALPPGSGLFLAAETDGWQAERQLHDFLREARALCREQGQVFIGYDDLHWGDDTVHDLNDIQDYPLGVGAKIRRWHDLGADGVFDHWGAFNRDISCNSMACREFFLNPLADPAAVCRGIAVKQFGETAGLSAWRAWQSLERAHAILSNACTWPPAQWPGWYAGRESAPLPGDFAAHGIAGGEPPRASALITYNPPDLPERIQRVADAWRAAYPHYQAAIASMRQAAAEAGDAPLFYAYWWNGGAKSPSRREHLRRQGIYLESMAVTGRELGLHFALDALYERLNRDPDAYKEQATELLREDIDACHAAGDYFERLKAQGDDRNAGRGWAALYRAKAERIQAYLEQ